MGLSEFLRRKSRVGDFVDHGEFTLAGGKALEKLALNTLVSPADWVLKMVQAAVVGRARELRFFFHRNRVRVCFPGLRVGVDLLKALLSPELSDDPAIRELVIGLRPFLRSGFLLMRCSGGRSCRWNGVDFVKLERGSRFFPNASDDALELVVLHPSAKGVGLFARRSFASADELRNLRLRAQFVPIPVYLDGRRLEPDFGDFERVRQVEEKVTLHRYLLAAGSLEREEVESQTLSRECLVARPSVKGAPLETKEPFLRLPASDRPLSTFCLVFARKEKVEQYGRALHFKHSSAEESFELKITRYGVVCGRLFSEGMPLGGYLQTEISEASADLSGLNVEPRSRELKGVLNALAPILDALESELFRHDLGKRAQLPSYLVQAGGASLVAGGMGLLLGGVTCGVGLFVGSTLVFGTTYSTDQSYEDLRQRAMEATRKMRSTCRGRRWKSTD